MSKVVFFIQAYNNESTLRRAADSILNQTSGEIILYLYDDVSTDSTRDIMLEYAGKDKRVKTVFHSKTQGAAGASGIYPFTVDLFTIIKEYDDNDYFCMLDADDEYLPDYLEKMIPYAEKNNLDIAACGLSMVNAQTGKIYDMRVPSENIILEGDAFGAQFPYYQQFFRSIWGKLYRISLLRKCTFKDYSNMKSVSHGGDALFNLVALLQAERVGLLPENLMSYYISPSSESKTFNSRRINSDRYVIEDSMSYLEKKTGEVSTINREFLFGVYLLAIMDTLSALIQSEMNLDDKFAGIQDIFTYPLTMELFGLDFSKTRMLSSPAMIDTRNRFVNDISAWMMSNIDARNVFVMDAAASAFRTLGVVPPKPDNWSAAGISLLHQKIRASM